MPYHACTRIAPFKTVWTIPRCLISQTDGQDFIHHSQAGDLDIRCGCRRTLSSPLGIRPSKHGTLFPYRSKSSEGEHSNRCVHGANTDLAASLGLPDGALKAVDDQFVLDFKVLFGDEEDANSSGSGTWQGKRANHLPRIYSLAWFLLSEAGLTTWTVHDNARNPWRDFQSSARAIRIAGQRSTLEECMLFPADVSNNGIMENRRKLYGAVPTKPRRVGTLLFAALLPESGVSEDPQQADLRDQLGVYLTIYPDLFGRAMSQCRAAHRHHQARRPVLMVGMATVKDIRVKGAQKPVIRLRAKHLALIPVGDGLAPTPTEVHWNALDAAVRTGGSYFVAAEEDAIVAMRCSPGSAASR